MPHSDDVFIICGPRQSGKTTALINWALEDVEHRVILVANQARRESLLRVADRFLSNLQRWPSVQTPESLFQWIRPSLGKQIGIDDYDSGSYLAGSFDPSYIAAVTYTSGECRNVPFAKIPLEVVISGLQAIVSDLR